MGSAMKLRWLVLICGFGWAPFAAAFQFGVCVHLAMAKSDSATVTRLIEHGGFNSIRDDAFWSGVERTQGMLEYPARYAESRRAMRTLRERGHQPIVILAYGNRFYDGGGFPVSAQGIAAYARYARFVVDTTRDSVGQFEVWNEWNSGFGSKPKIRSGSAADYVDLLAPAAAAIRAANPDARVIGGVTAGVDLAWIRELIAAGGLRHLDAISVHSYTLFRHRVNPEGAINSLDKLHALLKNSEPQREIPVYVTEMGWPTNQGTHGVSERDAAKYLVRFMVLARSRPWIEGVWWYDLIDDGTSISNPQHRFGLVRSDVTPKPAFEVARRIAPLVTAGGSVSAFRIGARHYLATGTDGSGRWAMAWTLEEEYRDWSDGVPALAAAPAEYLPLVARLPADGFPVLFRWSGGTWQPDDAWQRVMRPPPQAPHEFRVTSYGESP
jgi:polysaccharide biosynthesis protein PslG